MKKKKGQTFTKSDSVVIAFRITREHHAKLQAIAEAQGLAVHEVARLLVGHNSGWLQEELQRVGAELKKMDIALERADKLLASERAQYEAARQSYIDMKATRAAMAIAVGAS